MKKHIKIGNIERSYSVIGNVAIIHFIKKSA